MRAPSVKLMCVLREVPLTETSCKRCKKTFAYYRRGRHRYFCQPCRELERKDANDFFNRQASLRRQAERLTAQLAHVEAEEA